MAVSGTKVNVNISWLPGDDGKPIGYFLGDPIRPSGVRQRIDGEDCLARTEPALLNTLETKLTLIADDDVWVAYPTGQTKLIPLIGASEQIKIIWSPSDRSEGVAYLFYPKDEIEDISENDYSGYIPIFPGKAYVFREARRKDIRMWDKYPEPSESWNAKVIYRLTDGGKLIGHAFQVVEDETEVEPEDKGAPIEPTTENIYRLEGGIFIPNPGFRAEVEKFEDGVSIWIAPDDT